MDNFKCIESREHVQKADVNVDDVATLMMVIAYAGGTDLVSPELYSQVKSLNKQSTAEDCHDVAHKLLDVMVSLRDGGNEFLSDDVFKEIWDPLKEVQKACKLGEEHEQATKT